MYRAGWTSANLTFNTLMLMMRGHGTRLFLASHRLRQRNKCAADVADVAFASAVGFSVHSVDYSMLLAGSKLTLHTICHVLPCGWHWVIVVGELMTRWRQSLHCFYSNSGGSRQPWRAC